MVCRLIDFALVVLKLLMFKVFGIIGVSKIESFNFSGTERINICYYFSSSIITQTIRRRNNRSNVFYKRSVFKIFAPVSESIFR